MNLQLTNKERLLLEDQKNHEEICVQKYNDYANSASDPQLKALFKQNAQTEQEHLNTINQLLSGQIPSMNQGQSGTQQQAQSPMQMQQQQSPQQTAQQPTMNFQGQNQSAGYQADQDLCTDMLMTEKYVSGTYDTAIFEFRDPQVRQLLNHIQKEEQQHGEAIFNYMQSVGMYNPQ
ncbi:MAG: spore coat protein [Firmicutes bacterium]|nr:spore coat protein [Bacillota bacterium]